jgi:hypothetical protein
MYISTDKKQTWPAQIPSGAGGTVSSGFFSDSFFKTISLGNKTARSTATGNPRCRPLILALGTIADSDNAKALTS